MDEQNLRVQVLTVSQVLPVSALVQQLNFEVSTKDKFTSKCCLRRR
jgi:hypothetical protein